MTKQDQSAFFEVMVDRLIVESFPEEKSLYFQGAVESEGKSKIDIIRGKVVWHINHSLSKRQKEVMRLYLLGKKEADIGLILGIKQQVVNIYKKRAINKLRDVMLA